MEKKKTARFALQWKLEIEVEDADNPVDYNVAPLLDKIELRNADVILPTRVADVQPDAARRRFHVILESEETWPLERINDNDLQPYRLQMDIHLKSRRADTFAVRPVQGVVYLPAIRPEMPAPVPVEGGGG